MDDDSRRLIRAWLQVARDETPALGENLAAFFRFMALWMAFNAYLTRRYPDSNGDHGKVETFAQDRPSKEAHCAALANQDYLAAVQTLKESHGVRGIRDMRPNRNDVREIRNERCLREVMDCVYQVRCNLFHGDKAFSDERDHALVKAAYTIVWTHMKPLFEV